MTRLSWERRSPGGSSEITVDLGSRVRQGAGDRPHRSRTTISSGSTRRWRPSSRPAPAWGSRPTAPTTASIPTRDGHRPAGARRSSTRPGSPATGRSDCGTRTWWRAPSSTRRSSACRSAEGRYQDAIEEVRNRQAVLVQRRSEVALARQQLADTAIVSPIDGAVSQKQASAGEYLAAGAPVVTVVRTHPLRLRLSVPEREAAGGEGGAGRARERRRRSHRLPGHGGASLAPDRRAESHPAHRGRDPQRARRACGPAAFAKAEVVTQADQTMVTVPASAIVVFAGVEKVIGVKDGKTVEIRCRRGRRQGDRVESRVRLRAGERADRWPSRGNLSAEGQAGARWRSRCRSSLRSASAGRSSPP